MEIRRIWTSTELSNYVEFPCHQQVMRIERITEILKSGKQRHEVVYGITSLTPEQASPERLLDLNRGHWSIENSLHYVRDTTFDEDRSQIRTKTAPQVMATLKNLAISILRLNSFNNIASALRHFAAQQSLTLALVGL
ncbi:MAG: ISAs1 family transposase [Chlorobium sp.]